MATNRTPHFPLLAIGMIGLVTGLWAGLLRLGWGLPVPRATLVGDHGPLMVAGFLGTLIGLERAVALDRTWALAGPALTALGTLTLSIGLSAAVSPLLIVAGSLGMVVTSGLIVREQPTLFTATLGLGAVALLIGNSAWLAGREMAVAASWWMGFLVLTIAGERLELSRLVQVSPASQAIFMVVAATLLVGLGLGGLSSALGSRLVGVSLGALTIWLFRHDIARRTVRQRGLARFTAVCLLSGYVWLATGGLLALRFGAVTAGQEFDAIVHSIFLGFVFAMIFGHAPIIFPAVLGLAVPFRPVFYAHVALLHLSVAVRLTGDLAPILPARAWGGLLNALAIIFFLGNTLRSVQLGFSAQQAKPTGPLVARTSRPRSRRGVRE